LTLYFSCDINSSMKVRQEFDTGDLVSIVHQNHERGIVLRSELVHNGVMYPNEQKWHNDEYHCKVRFFDTGITRWVRPKWLKHLSKISR
jgi:hypothetical protein